MTDPSPIIPSVTDQPLTPNQQLLASLDGKTGRGGCEHCDAVYEIIHAGQGIAHMRIRHEPSCPIILRRLREQALGSLGFIQHHDPGDEQE